MTKAADINDTLRTEGPDAVRARHDKAHKYNGGFGVFPFDSRFRLEPFDEVKLSTMPQLSGQGHHPAQPAWPSSGGRRNAARASGRSI